MTSPTVNANTAREATLFLEALFAGKPDELHLLLWTLPEKQSSWFQNVESAIQFAESMRQHDLYVGVGFSGRDYGASRRRPAWSRGGSRSRSGDGCPSVCSLCWKRCGHGLGPERPSA